ncbi:MAG: hypothetical protein IPO38_13400 [Rhodocyclaceae bacterium]|nr:hypothetical protein [Rhodocyclaceae bacterium]
MFGIGLARPIVGEYAELIARINAFGGPVLALDIPSGLSADSGDIGGTAGCAVRATHTLTFIAGKAGLYTLDGPDHCGVIQIDHLGLKIASGNGAILTRADYVNCLRPRAKHA